MLADMQNQGVNAPATQSQAANQQNPETGKNTGFFQEDSETYSSMRLMCFVSLLAAIGISFLTLKTGNSDGMTITFGFLVSAFAPKAVQKFAEQKVPVKV